MDLKDLKRGDKIKNVEFGYKLYKAKVIENFPHKNKIHLKLNFGLWGLIGMKIVKNYHEYNFDLIRE